MDHTQLPPNGTVHTPFDIHSARTKKASLYDGVLEAPGVKTLSKPFRNSPDPDKDFDPVPSLTNGSSRGDSPPYSSVVAEFEHPSYVLEGPIASTAVQCSSGSQSLTGPNSPVSATSDRIESIGMPPRRLATRDQDIENNSPRIPKTPVMKARSYQYRVPAIIAPNTMENLQAEKSDEESSIESEDLDDNDDADENSNSSWSLHIQLLEAAILKAFGGDLNLAAFFLSNLDEILGLHNSRDISRQKVCSWIQHSPNSSETSSRKTQSSYASQGTSDSAGQNGKRRRTVIPKYPEGRRDRDEEEDDQQESDPKKHKENEHGATDGDPLLACPFWKKDPNKYNKHFLSHTNPKMNKYGRCEGPGFATMHRLKEHLERKHTHAQCERCGDVFDGSDEVTRAKRLQDHLRLAIPCELRDTIVKEGISTTQWATLRKQADKKGKGNPRPIGKSTVEKWNEIWEVLFPGVPVPPNPWHPRESSQNPSLLFGDQSSLDYFRRFFASALNQKAQRAEILINEVAISQVVDLSAQCFHFTLSQGVQDLTLGTSSGRPHSSDYGSLLGGSYFDIPPSSAGTAIRDQNMNQLLDPSSISQRAPQADMASGPHANGSPALNISQLYVQGIDHNAIPSMNPSSGSMNQFATFHAGTSMARTMSGQYISDFGTTPSFANAYPLDEELNYTMPDSSFSNNGLHSYGNGSQNNENQVLYQTRARVQPSPATQFRNPSEFGQSPHDSRR